jgi:hypothetical protein
MGLSTYTIGDHVIRVIRTYVEDEIDNHGDRIYGSRLDYDPNHWP